MRKIESLMNRAIAAGKDWKNANTEVINADGVSSVYLHGNLIAEITDDAMKILMAVGSPTPPSPSECPAVCLRSSWRVRLSVRLDMVHPPVDW